MSRTMELPTVRSLSARSRRTGLIGACLVVLAGLVFLAGPPLTASAPTPVEGGLQSSILACKLRVIRAAPVPAPATDTFDQIAATKAADGYQIRGVVTATGTSGARMTLPWSCATEPQGTSWRVWHVAVGNQ